jgi:hypothetical protein
MKYKVLTLTQPWATLIAIGAKHIETRSWSTSYRGPLLIHAGAGPSTIGWPQLNHISRHTEPFKSVLKLTDHPANALPIGAIVAVARLEACVDTFFLDREGRARVTGFDGERRYWNLTEQERAFGDYTPGRFAWLLADVRPLTTPIPAKDALGLWTWEGELPL